MYMETIEFQNENYSFFNECNECDEDFTLQFYNKSKVGQCWHHWQEIIFHTREGFVAAYRDDLTNFWNI